MVVSSQRIQLRKPTRPSYLVVLSAVVLILLLATGSLRASEKFPAYPAIKNNVTFWEKIYASYSLNQAVIHDSQDLSKIYEVISQYNSAIPGAASRNSKAQKRARSKYSTMLKKLSRQKPVSKSEKKVATLFSGKYQRRNMGRAAEHVRSQSGQKERFREGVIRSGRYMKEMKRILRSYRLPAELAYLPHVESSFNTKAYSKFGAAGIWQFTRNTGKQYLTISYEVDERLDPIAATHAAAKYLKKSYRHLGDWPLAITSYNYGLPGMMRAKKALASYEKIFKNYNKGHFKFASRNFYSEFLAALQVAKKLEKDPKVRMQKDGAYQYFKLKGFVDVKSLSIYFNVPVTKIKNLNPALRPPVFSGEKRIPKGYSLRLPADKTIQSKLSSFPRKYLHTKQRPSLYHRVQKGETASTIAKKHGVSLKNLMKVNNLDKYATIYIKQKLRIPKAGTPQASTSKPWKNSNSKTLKKTAIPTLSDTKKQRPSEQGADFIPLQNPSVYNVFSLHKKNNKLHGYITVQPEETLAMYSQWLKTSVANLQKLNNFRTNGGIEPGQQVLLVFTNLAPSDFEDLRLDYLQETEDDFFSAFRVVGQIHYQVEAGDTLWDLCHNKFDIPLWLLERYNSAINLRKLKKNEELIIPIVHPL